MTTVSDIRKTVTDTNPVYAAVGVTDLVVEKVRDGAAAARDFNVSALQDMAVQRAEQASQIPVLALNQTLEAAGKAQSTYAKLAVRGERLVRRIRNQKSTRDLVAQAGTTVAFGKGAVTTVRKAAGDTKRAAKSTLTTGRHEAEAVSASVRGDAKNIKRTVRKSGPATRLATKRTATVAKKRTASVKRATKATVTSAGTTATAATQAAKTAAPKIGD